MYHYEAKIIRVIDGDTIKLNVDLGFKIWINITARLKGINAPEGKITEASAYLNSFLTPDTMVNIQTYKTAEKYGRWLVDIYFEDRHINQELVDKNLAVVYNP